MELSKGVVCLWIGLAVRIPAHSQNISTAGGTSTWSSALSVTVDASGSLFVADYLASLVYKIDRLGATTVVAGTAGSAGFAGDGQLATSAKLSGPASVAVDTDGTMYIADYGNNRIRKVDTHGIITTFAGTNIAGFAGDGGPAASARLSLPYHIALDGKGNLFFSDHGNFRIRKIDKNGTISTVAGTGHLGSSGTGGPALLADIDPSGLTVTSDGSIYFDDDGAGSFGGDGLHRVRKISPDGSTVSLIAGNGKSGYTGDGGPAIDATFLHPLGIAVDSGGNVFVADFAASVIRKVGLNGLINTYAGTTAGFSGDGGPAIKAQLNGPSDLAVDSSGNLYIAEYNNHRIRKVTPPPLPNISTDAAGVPSFLGKAGFSSNSYIEIYGTNLSQTTRPWAGSDFNGPNAPTSLDGVSVTINGKPAFVYYVSPTQINVNTPDDTSSGPVTIQVQTPLGLSNTGTATRNIVSPTLQTVPQFLVSGKQYVVAQTPDFTSFIGNPNMISGVPFKPAKPGDSVIIYALGCGPTSPATPAGVVASQNSPLAMTYQLNIGGVPANVTFAGVSANTIGLYQINATIPNVQAGDQPIEFIVGGVRNSQNLVITIGQ